MGSGRRTYLAGSGIVRPGLPDQDAGLALARWNANDSPSVALALVVVIGILPLISEIKYRTRSPLASLEGTVDAQVLLELAAWFVGGVLVVHLLSGIQLRTRPALRGNYLYLMTFCGMLFFGTALAAPSAVRMVRGFQTIAVVLVVALLLARGLEHVFFSIDHLTTIVQFSALILLLATLALPGFDLFTAPSYFGIRRVRFLEMHPIGSANLLALVTLLSVFRLTTNWSQRRYLQLLDLVSVLAATGLLLATRSRAVTAGALSGAVAIIAYQAWRSGDRRARAWIQIGLLGVASFGVLFFGSILRFVLRNEGLESLTTLNKRTEILDMVLDVWDTAFFFGHGHLAGRSALLGYFPWAGESHNLLAEILLSYGLLGGALLGVGAIVSILRARRLVRARSPAGGLYLGLLLLVSAQSTIGDGFLGAPGFDLTAFCLVLVVGWGSASIMSSGSTWHRSIGQSEEKANASM